MASCLTLFVPCWNITVVFRRGIYAHGQLPDRERAKKKKKARQNYCGYGQLPDLVLFRLEQNSSNSRQATDSCLFFGGPRRKMVKLDVIISVMARCLTSFVPS